MRVCRFDHDHLGLIAGNSLVDVSAALQVITPQRWPYPPGDALIANWHSIRPEIERLAADAPRRRLVDVALQSPVANPTKIIGIAKNRKNLANETIDHGVSFGGIGRRDEDSIQMFIKAPSALAGPSDGVTLRFPERRNDPEAELTVVIGKTGSKIDRAAALDHIFGYCIGLDMTLRGPEFPSVRKSIDGYALLGPWIVTRDELEDPDNVSTSLLVNGREVQTANTRDLAFDVRTLIANASNYFTLYPGDAIMVGTPAGFAAVKCGDLIEAEFSSIGRMEVRVRADTD